MGTEDGVSFPQEDLLDEKSGKEFLRRKVIVALRRMTDQLWDSTFYIPIIPGDWVTFPTQAMR